jgi:hypothetical protein
MSKRKYKKIEIIFWCAYADFILLKGRSNLLLERTILKFKQYLYNSGKKNSIIPFNKKTLLNIVSVYRIYFFFSKKVLEVNILLNIFFTIFKKSCEKEKKRKQTACLCIIMQFILMEIRLSYMHIVHIKVNRLLL